MARRLQNERYAGAYFSWVLTKRNGVWWADGRSNKINVGRHSLATIERVQAIKALQRLDVTKAVEFGLAEADELKSADDKVLTLEEGKQIYEKHYSLAKSAGGTEKTTQSSYGNSIDQFIDYLQSIRVLTWNRVRKQHIEGFLTSLEKKGKAFGTQRKHATAVKSAINYLCEEKFLPPECNFVLRMLKPEGTSTYCWRKEEVIAILNCCQAMPDLGWVGDVCACLAYTGMRIGEAIDLRWSNLCLNDGMIRLIDERTSSRRFVGRQVRRLKTGRERIFPINEEWLPRLLAAPRHKDGFVFHGPRGGRLKDDTVRDNLTDVVLVALAKQFPTPEGDTGFAHGRLHSFRHFFCSMCANTGVPMPTVMKWLGHKDSKMVLYYYDLKDEDSRRQMRRIKLFGDVAIDS